MKQCIDCEKPFTFTPTLKERGMTSATAKFLFIDAKGGRCTDCFIKHRNEETSALMQKKKLAFPLNVCHTTRIQ